MIGGMISNMMVKPGQSPLSDNPEAHGLDHEDVQFQAEDGTALRGWLISGGEDRVIVQSHFGVQCNRGGWPPKGKGPTLVVQNKKDPWTRMGMVKDCCTALNVENELRLPDIEKGRFAACDHIGRMPEDLMGWFDAHMKGQPT